MEAQEWTNLIAVIVGLLLLGLVLSGVLAVWIIARVRRLRLPPDADLLTALRHTPFSVVLLLDLLDFSLDIFSAPLAWGLLGYLGLQPLRGITVVEALIPGTQFLPTMTVAWLVARLVKRDSWPLPGV